MSKVVSISRGKVVSLPVKPANYAEMTDTELVIAAKENDERATAELLARHKKTIESLFRRMAPDWKDNSDLVQEAMIRVWRAVGTIRNPYSFMSWLKQITQNIFYDELRRRPRPGQMVYLDEPIGSDEGNENTTRDITDARPLPEDQLLGGELNTVLMNAYGKIPADFRQAAMLRDIDGLSYEEIAVITNTELGTVKSRISRARTKMQRCIKPYLKEIA